MKALRCALFTRWFSEELLSWQKKALVQLGLKAVGDRTPQ
jgi:hypothetical protein